MFMSEERRERGGGERDGDREIEKLKESDRERERERSGREGRKGEIQERKNIGMYLSCLLPLLLIPSQLAFSAWEHRSALSHM